MTETDLFVALALLLAGVAIGILVMICLGIRRDDQPGGFPAHWPAPTASTALSVRRRIADQEGQGAGGRDGHDGGQRGC